MSNSGRFEKGSAHPNWKGGETTTRDGYKVIYAPDHPNSNSHKRVAKHRLIYENYLSILFDEEIIIPRDWEVHHIKPVKQGGTNALINLKLLSRGDHVRIHKLNHTFNRKDKSDRFCLQCNKKTWTDKNGIEIWHSYQNGFICQNCYQRKRRREKKCI